MDALPISEELNEPFSSKNPGVMHACGHDAHMAIVLGLAKVLSNCLDEMCGAVKFIFQPGEEANGGARLMIDAGALENPHVDVIYALHMVPEIESGMIGVREGYMTATDDEVVIRVNGLSAHSSAPHDGVNAVTIAAHMITAMQTVLTESLSPHDVAVFSICTIKGGDALNIIPDCAEMTGMLRCVEKSKKQLLGERIRQICEGIAQAFGGKVEVDIKEGFPAVNNDKMYTGILVKCAEEVMDPADIIMIQSPHMGSEDFSYYQEVIPGVIFMLGSKPSDGNGGSLHSPDLRICEDSLLTGVRIFAALAFRLCI
jgi:amidohydrolase